MHATWLDLEQRFQKSFVSVEYVFCIRFPIINRLNEEFINYQLLSLSNIPLTIKESANFSEEDPHRVDMLWGYLRGVKKPGASELAFDLFSVAEVMMSIPHSNAGEETFCHLLIKTRHLIEVCLNLKALYMNSNISIMSKYFQA